MRWTLIASVAIVAFDAVTAVAARALDFDYGGLPGVIGSTAIYAFPAIMVARDGHKVRLAALAGATVAFVDATLGWAISWVIGPGAPPPDSRSPAQLILAAITVVALGGVIGLVAGFVARRLRPKSSRSGESGT